MNSATATSLETAADGATRRPLAQQAVPELAASDDTKALLRKAFQKKYRHVAAIHSHSRPSCLSHDAPESPSFIGFRNLMVIVLGMCHAPRALACVVAVVVAVVVAAIVVGFHLRHVLPSRWKPPSHD